MSFVTANEFSVRVTKITRKIGVSWTDPPFCFWSIFNLMNYGHIIKRGCKPDNFESRSSLKVSFTNICGLCSNFVECESFLIKLSLLSGSVWDKPGWLNSFWQCLSERLSSFNSKGIYYSHAWSHNLCEGRTSFCMGLIYRKLCRYLFMFSTGFTSLNVLLLFPLSITFFVFIHSFLFYFN